MVYFSRNNNRRLIEREPLRRDYHSQQRSYRGFDDYNPAPLAMKTSRFVGGQRRESNFRRRDDYDYISGDYDIYRKKYRSLAPNRHLAPKPLIRRRNWTLRSYEPNKYSSSRIRDPVYGVERYQKEMKYQIPQQRYNQKRRFPLHNYNKLSDNRENGNYHGQKMHHRRITTFHKYQIRTQRTTTTAVKQPSPALPPLPLLPESEVMMTDQNGFPALSSPSYSEGGEFLRSCSPVLKGSPDSCSAVIEGSPDSCGEFMHV